MVYLAALSACALDLDDFLRLIGHNQDCHNMHFSGYMEYLTKEMPEGKMIPYLYRVRDDKHDSKDLTVVLSFTKSSEEIDEASDAYQFYMNAHLDEIKTYVSTLVIKTQAQRVSEYVVCNGNVVYVLHDINTEWLASKFTELVRGSLKLV